MFLMIVQWAGGMFLLIGGITILWAIVDRLAEKKYRLHERIAELEQWKAGEDLRRSRARRIRKARQETESREQRLAREKIIWQNELAADLGRGDAFDQAYKELLDGNQ
jgi:FtsZ-binding cell division protein ZapB